MATKEESTGSGSGAGVELKEEDIVAAMGEIPGYLDITPRDFKEIYLLAFQHALERLSREVAVGEIMTREVVWVKHGHAAGRGGRGHGPAGHFRGAGGQRQPAGGRGGLRKGFPAGHGRAGVPELHDPGGVLPAQQRLRGPAHQKTDRGGPHERAGGDGAAGNPGAGGGRAVCRTGISTGPR